MREEVYDISGMHCAACSASVEKVTRRLPGGERSDVNLVAERMTIVYDETQVTPEQIIAKVEKAGFGAKLHQEKQEAAPVQTGEDPEEAELRRKKRELIVSAIFSCALLYVSMGQMLPFGLPALPLPDLFSMHTHPMNFAVLQLMLAIPVLYCGRNFFINGFQALFHGNPNMDSLVAIGSACSFVYSVVMMFLITDDVHGHVHNLYYESSAVVLTLVSLGKFMESRNMKKTKSAITALMRLTPDTALLADSGKEVPTSAVKAGDVLLVKPGARVPLDGVVVKGESSVNEAMLTGESLPVEKAEGSEVIGGSVNLLDQNAAHDIVRGFLGHLALGDLLVQGGCQLVLMTLCAGGAGSIHQGGVALRCENLGNAAAHRTGAEYCYFHDSSSYLNFYMNCLIIRRCACQLTYLF